MKKLLATAMIIGSGLIAVPSLQAAPMTGMSASLDPQIRVQIGRNRRYRNRRVRRVVTTTRIRRIGFRTYRETIRTVYMPNGTVRTTVINRERIRG